MLIVVQSKQPISFLSFCAHLTVLKNITKYYLISSVVLGEMMKKIKRS